jgi:hypothetical protein
MVLLGASLINSLTISLATSSLVGLTSVAGVERDHHGSFVDWQWWRTNWSCR